MMETSGLSCHISNTEMNYKTLSGLGTRVVKQRRLTTADSTARQRASYADTPVRYIVIHARGDESREQNSNRDK